MTTYSDTSTDLIINRLTKTQFESATGLDPTQEYHVDPEFTGGKLLETTADGDIVESSKTIPTKTSDLANDSGFITSSALSGYATETWVGQQGYITGITSAMVTTALGYSPVNPTSLASVATSGSYNDLSNKPTIPAAQVNSDWNANSGVAQILNKPTLATVATSGAYSDLSGKPTIPTVNNPTITITQGGVTKGSFTLNQSTGDTIELDAGGGGSVNTFDLFDHKWSDYLLSDQSWLRADTFSWQDGTVYSDAYDHIVADYNGGTSQTETVGSYTITYKLASDGHKITTDETNVLNIYNESGVAWYYILDTANTRFKLPRENPAREELVQVIRAKGNGISLGLTNGTTTTGLQGSAYADNYAIGVYTNSYGINVGSNTSATTNIISGSLGITTDPAKSGIISSMTDSTSVYKGKKYLYFYVGQFSQTATEQTAGLNSELFNGKMDRDMSNMNASQTAKQTIDGWGKPDFSAEISISSPYTPTQNGFISICVKGAYSTINFNVDGVNVIQEYTDVSGVNQENILRLIPVIKGKEYSWSYTAGTLKYAKFTPDFGG